MHMNTDTSATDTNQEGVLMQNLEQGEFIDMPIMMHQLQNWAFHIQGIQKCDENISSTMTKYES